MAEVSTFPLLRSVSNIMRVFGWVLCGLGVIGAIAGVFGGDLLGVGSLLGVVLGIVLVIGGLLTIAFSELIGVFFAIEYNGRRLLEQMGVDYRQRLRNLGGEGEE